MTYKSKIRKDDFVKVISGDEKGKVGKVLKVLPKELRLFVEGVNLVNTRKKKSDGSKESILKEAALQISNVAFFDKELSVATKIGFDVSKQGEKSRVGKKTKKNY